MQWRNVDMRGRGPTWMGALALLLAGGLGACYSFDANVHNLRELHRPDGQPRYRAATMGAFEYSMRLAISDGFLDKTGFDLTTKKPKSIDDPHGETLSNLISLARKEPDSARVLALQTELFGWLAVEDPFVLARERSVIELGRIGRRLGVVDTLSLPPAEEIANADDVRKLVANLASAVLPLLAGDSDGAVWVAEQERLADVCEQMAALNLDLSGGRRVLAATAAMVGADGGSRSEMDPVRELLRDIAWRVASLSLARAVDDESPVVRQVALQAWVTSSNNRRPDLILRALDEREASVARTALNLIQIHGLPLPLDELEGQALADYKAGWIQRLVEQAQHFNGEVAAAACRALGTVSGADLHSQRGEDWADWYAQETGVKL